MYRDNDGGILKVVLSSKDLCGECMIVEGVRSGDDAEMTGASSCHQRKRITGGDIHGSWSWEWTHVRSIKVESSEVRIKE
jgi:hypothetical protein